MKDRDWDVLFSRISSGRCTPFIGAGASVPALPLGGEVAEAWAEEFGYPFTDQRDLARVSQFLAIDRGDPVYPKEIIAEQLRAASPPDFSVPVQPHGVLAGLPLPVYLTTNYDDFMGQALEARGKEPVREMCRWNHYLRQVLDASVFEKNYDPSEQAPVVFHLHGHLDTPESLVLTEDDYLSFVVNLSRHRDLLPDRIQQALAGASLLFVGYSLEDWTFKVIFQGLVAAMEDSLRRINIAVQLPREDENQTSYLDEYLDQSKVRVFWGTADDFMAELGQRWAERSDDG